MTSTETSKRLVVWVWDTSAAVWQDRLSAAAQTIRGCAAISLVTKRLTWCRAPAIKDRLVIDTRLRQLSTTRVDEGIIAERPTGNLLNATGPDVELVRLFGTKWEARKQVNDVKTLAHAPYRVANSGLRVRSDFRRAGVFVHIADVQRVTYQVQGSYIVCAQRYLESRRWPRFAVRIALRRGDTREHKCALAVSEASQPMAK